MNKHSCGAVELRAAFLQPWIRFCNLAWEYRLGINTRGYTETRLHDARYYVTMPYLSVLAILQNLALKLEIKVTK
ncbi:MAG TPA: hypothetical protein VGX03_12720 [Candidatus Binatia bacterium]|nr:hypothetical protein [Candidatus Binatia bacterium]